MMPAFRILLLTTVLRVAVALPLLMRTREADAAPHPPTKARVSSCLSNCRPALPPRPNRAVLLFDAIQEVGAYREVHRGAPDAPLRVRLVAPLPEGVKEPDP